MLQRQVTKICFLLGKACMIVVAIAAVVLGCRTTLAKGGDLANMDPFGVATGAPASSAYARWMPWMSKAGVKWARLGVSWRVIEPQRGVWNFKTLDSMIQGGAANGIGSANCFGGVSVSIVATRVLIAPTPPDAIRVGPTPDLLADPMEYILTVYSFTTHRGSTPGPIPFRCTISGPGQTMFPSSLHIPGEKWITTKSGMSRNPLLPVEPRPNTADLCACRTTPPGKPTPTSRLV